MGACLAAAGVVPWLLVAVGFAPGWPRQAHASMQIQGFLTCFAVGFLFTFIPRRLKASFPATWEAAPLLVGLPLVSVLSWAGRERLAQLLWGLLILLVLGFAGRRMAPAVRSQRVPPEFLWIPLSLLLAAAGPMSAALFAQTSPRVAAIGATLVWQGLFGGLIIGIGVLLLPVMTRGSSWPESAGSLRAWLLQAAGAALFFGSFPLEELGFTSEAYWIRGGVSLALLVFVGRIFRFPNMPGVHRELAWGACWFVPVGFIGAALLPAHRLALMHLTYIGGFGLLTFAVGNHVLVAHCGQKERLGARPRRLIAFGAALVIAVAVRLLVAFDSTRLLLWVGVGAAVFIAGVVCWLSWTLPRLRDSR